MAPAALSVLSTATVLFLQQHIAQSDGVAVSVAPSPGPAGISPSAWNAIIVFGVMLAGLCLTIGASLADNRHLKKDTKDTADRIERETKAAIAGIERDVARELQGMKATLADILEVQREGLKSQIEDAGWRAEIAGQVRDATKTAEQASATAHRLRNTLAEEEFERRTGLPDRRQS